MAKMRLKGRVKRNKMEKTVVVEVFRRKEHPKYKKILNMKKNYYAHTEDPIEVGAEVMIEESKPISKLKRWKVVEIVDEDSKK